MRDIIEEKINRVLNEKEFRWFFKTEEDGLYGVEIMASCKSWRQNFSIQDDDLAVKIDRFSFPQKKDRKKLFDGEAAWNGNNLKGLKKTGLFILPLKEGSHALAFLANRQPFLESIRIFQIEENEFSYLPQDNPPEDGNRRQWLVIVLSHVGLGSIFVEAKAQPGENYPNFFHDDGDLKIVINGIIQKNYEKKSHKNWYWCGRSSKGESQQLFQQLDFKPDLHYLEFYADRSPTVQSIAINLGDNIQTQEMFLPRAKIITKEANLRTESRIASDVLALLREGDEVLVIEPAKLGEAPYEQLGDFTNTWHRVKFQGKEGYIFAKFLEIQGEDKDTIREKIIAAAKKYDQDPCLILAIAQKESQLFPYAVSNVDAQGLFQLTKIAIKAVQERFFQEEIDKKIDRFNVDQNIEAGVLYFKYLKGIYRNEKDSNDAIKQQLAAWNRGQSFVPSNMKFQLEKQPLIVRQFIKDVLRYKKIC